MEFGGLPLEWVKSYFCNGSQFVEFNNYRFLGVLLDDNVTWKSYLSGARNVNFWKISVRETIWDLEFSEHLL